MPFVKGKSNEENANEEGKGRLLFIRDYGLKIRSV